MPAARLQIAFKVLFFVCYLALPACFQNTEIHSSPASSVTSDQVQIVLTYPSTSFVRLRQIDSQLFSITASGNGLSYSWKLNGTLVPGALSDSFNFDASLYATGDFTLEALATDIEARTAANTWSVRIDTPPIITTPVPNPGVATLLNYNSNNNYSIVVTDADGDTLTYTWQLDGATNGALTSFGTSANFNPAGNSNFIGAHTIQVIVSDGIQTAAQSWPIKVNAFSDACNNLNPGEICTLTGKVGMGDNTDLSVATNAAKVTMYPGLMSKHPDGLFISDINNNVVWFWNQSGSSVNILNQTINSGHIKIVAGSGIAGISIDGLSATSSRLYSPMGTAWDSVTQSLFIADYNNHRIVQVRTDGTASRTMCSMSILNNSASNTTSGSAISHACAYPYGIALDTSTRELFVNTNSSSFSSIKVFDISNANPANWTGSVLIGLAGGTTVSTASNIDGPASTAKVSQPTALVMDTNKNIFLTSRGSSECLLRVYNRGIVDISFFDGDITVSPGDLATISGGNCTTTEGLNSSQVRFNSPTGLSLNEVAGTGTLLGFFIPTSTGSKVLYLNNTSSSITIGDKLVAAKEGRSVLGTGIVGLNGDSLTGTTTKIYVSSNPYGLLFDEISQKLFFADSGNFRVRSLDTSIMSGTVTSHVGESLATGNSIVAGHAPDLRMTQPISMSYDSYQNSLGILDLTSFQDIRKINLDTGVFEKYVTGATGTPVELDNPSSFKMASPKSISFIDDLLLISEGNNPGAQQCVTRALNLSGSNQNLWGINLLSNIVTTIAGALNINCGTFSSGGSAVGSFINRINSVTTDFSGNLILSNFGDDCLLKVDTSGNISVFFGQCGSAGIVDDIIGGSSSRTTDPEALVRDPLGSGIMYVELTATTNSRIVYLNLSGSSVTVLGVSIPALSSKRILTSAPGYGKALAAYDNQICISSGSQLAGASNVTCYDRDTGFTSRRIGGLNTDTIKGGTQFATEFEGISSSSALLYDPIGLNFDADGNLYILESRHARVRKVKRWW